MSANAQQAIQAPTAQAPTAQAPTAQAIFPLMPSEDLAATEEFYTRNGFDKVIGGEGYVQLAYRAKPDIQIGFFKPMPDHPVAFFRARQADNVVLSVVVDDLDATLAMAREAGQTLAVELRREPWGQRHFAVADPNGLIIDFNEV